MPFLHHRPQNSGKNAKKKMHKKAGGVSIKNYSFLNSALSYEIRFINILVFLHGFPDSATSWRYYMSALSTQGFHCLAPNQRGYGQTDKPIPIMDYHIDFLVGNNFKTKIFLISIILFLNLV